MQAIVFDIDGTLADVGHRLHYVTGGNSDWNGFFQEIPNDKPNVELVELAQFLLTSNDKKVLFATGRPERTRQDTISWLVRHKIETDFRSCLFMRKEGDRREDHKINMIFSPT